MRARVLMFLSCLNPAGGVEQYVVSLLPELQRLGATVILCMAEPPAPDNQYARVLRARGFTIHYLHIGPLVLCNWTWLSHTILLLMFPFTLMAMGADMLRRRRGWRRSFDGLRGWLNDIVKIWLPSSGPALPVWAMLSFLWMRYRPEILHVLRADSVLALEWGVRRGVPCIYTEALEPGGDLVLPQFRPYYRRLEDMIPGLSAIITQSERVRRSIEDRWRANGRTHVLPWVVSPPPSNHDEQTRTPEGTITFGSAGRLAPEKDLKTFLRAARLLLDRYPEKVRFVVAGGGAEESELKEYAANLGLGSHLRFTGAYSLDSMPEIYAQFDVFVLSSLTEGAPLAVMEAMAYDKPVVATDVAGTGELVMDGETGFLVQPRDAEALAHACARFVQDPNRIAEMGQRARRLYEQAYTVEVGAVRLLELYDKVSRERYRKAGNRQWRFGVRRRQQW